MKVVVLGAGYAGVTAVMRLVRSKFPGEVVLVNDGPHHQLTTQMHRVAAGAVEPAAVLLSIDTLLRWTPARLVQGKATAIDPERRLVQLEDGRELDYDRLVVALGSRIETFGVPGVLEHALTVQPVQEALRTRRHLTARLHDAAFWDGEERRASLRFVIVGGGLTGVEVAGELADRLPAEARGLGMDPSELEIVIIEAGRRLLPGLDERIAMRAGQILERKHVAVWTETPVTEVVEPPSPYDDAPVGVARGRRPFRPRPHRHLGRGRAGPRAGGAHLRVGERGRALVDEYLRARDYPDVYIVGDSAYAVPQDRGQAAAPTAQNAVHQAEGRGQEPPGRGGRGGGKGRRRPAWCRTPPGTGACWFRWASAKPWGSCRWANFGGRGCRAFRPTRSSGPRSSGTNWVCSRAETSID